MEDIKETEKLQKKKRKLDERKNKDTYIWIEKKMERMETKERQRNRITGCIWRDNSVRLKSRSSYKHCDALTCFMHT